MRGDIMKKKYTLIKANKSSARSFRRRIVAADEQSYKDKQLERRANAKLKKIAAIQDSKADTKTRMNELFKLLVPASGSSKYEGGELIRAMSKILYRDYNDGDVFYEGYGIETCGSAVAFLCDKMPQLTQMFEDIAYRNLEGTSYTHSINEIAEEVMDEIFADPEKAVSRNTEDYLDYDGEDFIRDQEWEPKYEESFSYPDNIQYHLDNGDITERDLQWDIQDWDYCRNGEVNCDRYGVNIYDLRRDDYEEIVHNMGRWLEDYGNDLDEEYGSEEDEYDDDEEYDDEDDEE